jgi:GNAT superfamily N-acetyltransferase
MTEGADRLPVTVSDKPDRAAKDAAAISLYRYNVEATGIDDRRPVGATVSDTAGDTILGGLWGRTELGVLFLDMLFVAEELRGTGTGARLLASVEEEARQRGCRRAVVETSSFQAPDFYELHGYREIGRVEFVPSGLARIFLSKELD